MTDAHSGFQEVTLYNILVQGMYPQSSELDCSLEDCDALKFAYSKPWPWYSSGLKQDFWAMINKLTFKVVIQNSFKTQ